MPAFRPLYYALLMSAALHVWLLWPQTLPEKVRSQALSARLLPSVEVVVAPKLPPHQGKEMPAVAIGEHPSSVGAAAHRQTPALSQEPLPVPATLALPTPGGAVDAGGLRVYRTALALGLRRSGAFAQGVTPGMRGRLEAEIILSAQGQVMALGIVQSSGHKGLDELALRALGEVAPHTTLPPVLLGQMFRVVVPLEVE
jgi:TonB family protein